MSAKPWPPVPIAPEAFDANYPCCDWSFTIVKNCTCCKHGDGPCESCGTTNKRDYKHKTRGGKGVVARIPNRRT